MTTDDLFDARDRFAIEYSQLVARTLDSLPEDAKPEDGDALIRIISDSSNPYGCGWSGYSTRWSPPTLKDLVQFPEDNTP